MKGKVKEIVDAHGASLIKAVMDERLMGKVDFWQSKGRRFVKARRLAMRRLREDGFSIGHIAELMHMQKRTIEYHMSEKNRLRRISMRIAAYQRAKQAAAEARV